MLYSVTVTNHKGIDGVVTSTSGETFLTSHPLNDKKGTNPEELLASAWATCLHATLHAVLLENQIMHQSRVDVTAQLHREADATGYFFDMHAEVGIQNLDISQAQIYVKQAHERCPISKLFIGAKSVSVSCVEYLA